MERKIIATRDGSHTVSIPEMNVTYHSIHGAVQESQHVFIDAGFRHAATDLHAIDIFEMGFGTGLNAFLTVLETHKTGIKSTYTCVELHPLNEDEIRDLGYARTPLEQDLFEKLHRCPSDDDCLLTEHFLIRKEHRSLFDFSPARRFHLVYFDAFAPSAQPELWTEEVFRKLFDMLLPGGILVTYCSKGDVRRAMMKAGFSIEKIPGPPGKREMVRATRP